MMLLWISLFRKPCALTAHSIKLTSCARLRKNLVVISEAQLALKVGPDEMRRPLRNGRKSWKACRKCWPFKSHWNSKKTHVWHSKKTNVLAITKIKPSSSSMLVCSLSGVDTLLILSCERLLVRLCVCVCVCVHSRVLAYAGLGLNLEIRGTRHRHETGIALHKRVSRE
jgi:hypothetical protein